MRPITPRFFPLALLALAGFGGCAKEPAGPPEPPAPQIYGDKVTYPENAPQLAYLKVEAAAPRRFSVAHLTGRVYLADDATVRVFTPVAGQVASIEVDVGQAVEANAPLAKISSPDYGQALADARAADANFATADNALTRSRDLLAHGAAAQKDVEAAEAAYGAAIAERDRAAARLSLYHGSATSTDEVYVLRSPVRGVVVEKNINPGQEVRADQMLANATNLFAPLFVVSDLRKLWVQVDASEADLSELHSGQRIRVVSNAFPGREFGGTLANISPELDSTTRTIQVRGVVENPDELLKAEMYVTVDIVRDESEGKRSGVEVPSKAIFTIDQTTYLFVELAPGQFERRKVDMGTEAYGSVIVTAGVGPGQRVVTEGSLLLEAVLNPAN
jgi:membrane fusion protein, heavy metal efflux system